METQADYSLLNDPDMKEIFDSFVIETKEILEKLDIDLIELENRPDDTDLLNDIFRSFHTIKGTSGFLGLVKLQTLTHHGEDILNKLRKGEVQLNDSIMDAILKGYDATKELLDVIELNRNEDLDIDEVLHILETILKNIESGKVEETKEIKADSESPDQLNDNHTEIPEKVAEKENKKIEEVASELENEINESVTVEKELQDKEIEKSSTVETKSDEKKEGKLTADSVVDKSKNILSKRKGENTIRVDVERLDDLLNFVQELVLGRNQLAQLNTEMQMQYEGTDLARNLSETTRLIDLMTTELQLAVMKTRMVRIGKVFNRFPRLVRDLSKEMNKDIQLIITGEETELDKTLIEEINDPLVHLIRNSVDHGIESHEERKKRGKPQKGVVKLSAEHEGNNILISIEDDGKGIDPDKIKETAIAKGIISKDRSDELSLQDTYNLIFAPGFSTAQKVTNVSGRGVGMDVVKTNVAKLRGVIDIESEVGKGTKLLIKLPLTLAIIHGLLVEVSEQTVVIPLSSVIEVVRIDKEQIYSVNQTECIKLRDTIHPLIDIDQLMYKTNNGVSEKTWQYIVIVGIAEKRFGLKVDNLVGQKEVVIKSLGNYLGDIEGIAGSTIMGDGKVVMIADIAELVNKLSRKQ
jgi:two-component system chemotaxis sensor kinase CheA